MSLLLRNPFQPALRVTVWHQHLRAHARRTAGIEEPDPGVPSALETNCSSCNSVSFARGYPNLSAWHDDVRRLCSVARPAFERFEILGNATGHRDFLRGARVRPKRGCSISRCVTLMLTYDCGRARKFSNDRLE